MSQRYDGPALGKYDKISATKLLTFESCARKFFLRYFMKLREPTTIHMDRGTFAHTCLEEFYDSKRCPIQFSDDMFEQMVQRMEKIIAAEIQKTELLKLPEHEEMFEDTVNGLMFYLFTVYREFEKMVKKYNVYVAWSVVRPKFREMAIETEIAMGFIDFVHEDESGTVIIGDYKTSSIFKNTYNHEYIDQITFYCYLYREINGVTPKVGLVDFILYGKIHQIDVTEERVNAIEDRTHKLLIHRSKNWKREHEEMWPKSGPLTPENPDGYQWCKTCPYKTMLNPTTGEPYCDGQRSEDYDEILSQ